MNYCKSYCEEKGISTSILSDAQSTLYHIAENMRMSKSISEDGYEHFQQAIKALKQEPCEDAVSRKEVRKFVDYVQSIKDKHNLVGSPINYGTICDIVIIAHKLLDLPPVTPTRKVGKWEHGYSFPDGNYAKCTACGEIIKCTYPMHFCPNCGSDNRGEEQ